MRKFGRRSMAVLIVLTLLTSLLSNYGVLADEVGEVTIPEEIPSEEVTPEEEYPKDAEYDFTVPGSTVSFLDKDGALMTEKVDWLEGDGVVRKWHVFMYRRDMNDLKLGYTPEGTLFIPHRVYEGDTADLLYVHGNSLFRVTATKQDVQVFDGSALLRELTVSATDGTTVLANSPVYAQTPFGFVHVGNTDADAQLTLYATNGEFTLWVTSHQGYMLSKTFKVTDGVSELSFADAFEDAVEIDVKGRAETAEGADGYVVALGLPGDTDAVNKLTTSYVDPAQTVRVTPGTYSLATAIYLAVPATNTYIDGYYGLWIDLASEQEISQKTEFDFTIEGFEPVFELIDKKETYDVDDLMSFRLYAEHEGGYTIPGEADAENWGDYSVEVTDDGVAYPYTFYWGAFSALYDAYVYRVGNEDVVLHTFTDHDYEQSMPSMLFDTNEREYVVKYYPKWDSMACPALFPENVYYSETFTAAASYVLLSYDEIYLDYLDADGNWQYLYGDDTSIGYRWVFPQEVTEGTLLKMYTSSSEYNSTTYDYEITFDYCFEVLSDELVSKRYTFVPHAEKHKLEFEFVGDSEELQYYNPTATVWVDYQGSMVPLAELYQGNVTLPTGEYVLDAQISYTAWDEDGMEYTEHLEQVVPVNMTEDQSLIFSTEGCVSFMLDGSALTAVGGVMPESVDGDTPGGLIMDFAGGVQSTVSFAGTRVKVYMNELPHSAYVSMLYYDKRNEMNPFSPYVAYEEFMIEDGGVYCFDFAPKTVEIEDGVLYDSEDAVLQLTVKDGCGNPMTEISNLLNTVVVHDPLLSRPYPFVGEDGKPIDYQYVLDVYVRAKGESEYTRFSTTDLQQINLGRLPEGEYEGYAELLLDTYCDEYLTEYPYEKGIMYDEWWGVNRSVHDNVARVLHGTLSNTFAFTVQKGVHEHEFGTWQPDAEVQGQHVRTCACGEQQTEQCKWDNGILTTPPTAQANGEKTYTCSVCKAEKKQAVLRAVITFDGSYATDASKTYVISAEEGGEQFSFVLPESDVLGDHSGYVLIGWKCLQDGMFYTAGEVITGDWETELTFEAEWLILIGEGRHELRPDRWYMAIMENFTIEGDPSIYFGYQLILVEQEETYVFREVEYDKEDMAQ